MSGVEIFNKTFFPNTRRDVLGGVGVTCSPRDPRFAGSNPGKVDGFFSGRRNPEHKSPGRALSRESEISGSLKNLKPEKIDL